MRKIRPLASAALAVGCLAVFAPAAGAADLCVSAHVQVNDQVVDQSQCVPF